MTVKQLIAKLQKAEPNRLVVIAGENGTDLICLNPRKVEVSNTMYDGGTIGLEHLTLTLIKQGYTAEDVIQPAPGCRKAVVLWC